MFKGKKIVDVSHDILKDKINEGDWVVDATCGNGLDTLFLAEQVGDTGKVFAFDIQKQAIDNTFTLLSINNKIGNVELILDSHADINKYINKKIAGGIFNLGYLPMGNKEIITKEESTIKALSEMLKILNDDGIIVIVSYYGHAGGENEFIALKAYLKSLPKEYLVTEINFANRNNDPPVIFVLEK